MDSPGALSSIDLSTRSTTGLMGTEDNTQSQGETRAPSSTTSSSSSDFTSSSFPLPHMFAQVKEEYRRRWGHMFSSDYKDFFLAPSKSISASVFMFFATIFSTIALGAHLSEVGDYGEYIGVGEFLIMNSLSGLYFSIVSCQPLMILRPTGPITLIVENIILISEKYGINFWHLLACTGYFVGIWMVLIAAFEGSNKIGLLTRFTHEIFACFVCSIYIYNGVNDVVSNFHVKDEDGVNVFGKSLFMAVMAVSAFAISLLLSTCELPEMHHQSIKEDTTPKPTANLTRKEHVLNEVICSSRNETSIDRTDLWSTLSSSSDEKLNESHETRAPCVDVKWNIFTPRILSLLSDYAVTIAIVVVTIVSFMPVWIHHDSATDSNAQSIDRVRVPSGLSPTMTERTWLVSYGSYYYESFYTDEIENNSLVEDDKVIMLLMAFAISIPVVFFFYIDQNLSCVLSQSPHIESMKKGKGTYVHSPFLCVAVSNLIAPSFGLPFVTASLPHSPQFVHALTDNSKQRGGPTIAENRIAPLLVYASIGFVTFIPSVIRCIPLGWLSCFSYILNNIDEDRPACLCSLVVGAVRGVLAYVGFAGILTTELYKRLVCLLRPLPADLEMPSFTPDLENPTVVMSFWRVHFYTLIQVSMLLLFWVLNLSPQPAGLLVAFGVAALGPVRLYVLPHFFKREELALLDS